MSKWDETTVTSELYFEWAGDEEETPVHEPMSTDFVLTAHQIKTITDCGVDLVTLLMAGRARG